MNHDLSFSDVFLAALVVGPSLLGRSRTQLLPWTPISKRYSEISGPLFQT
jgi:hypothetical protein